MRNLILITLGMLLLSACSTTKSNPEIAAKITPPSTTSLDKNDIVENANVLLLRTKSMTYSLYGATFHIDGEKVVKLKNNQFSAINLEPGSYLLKVSFPLIAGGVSKAKWLEVVEGQQVFVNLDLRLYKLKDLIKIDSNLQKNPASLVVCCDYIEPMKR